MTLTFYLTKLFGRPVDELNELVSEQERRVPEASQKEVDQGSHEHGRVFDFHVVVLWGLWLKNLTIQDEKSPNRHMPLSEHYTTVKLAASRKLRNFRGSSARQAGRENCTSPQPIRLESGLVRPA